MNSLVLPVVHPAFQRLKRSGRLLHFMAGGLILSHAISHISQPHSNLLYLGCLFFIALDIFILVLAGNNLLTDMPRVNLFFRLVEILFFAGICTTLLLHRQWFLGVVHVLLALLYVFLLVCERRSNTREYVAIHHTGITIPHLPDSKFLLWVHVNSLEARYDSITIHTSTPKSYYFTLQHNLQFEELDQIHEFCRHYLGS